mgnify:CR=1 FL=1
MRNSNREFVHSFGAYSSGRRFKDSGLSTDLERGEAQLGVNRLTQKKEGENGAVRNIGWAAR